MAARKRHVLFKPRADVFHPQWLKIAKDAQNASIVRKFHYDFCWEHDSKKVEIGKVTVFVQMLIYRVLQTANVVTNHQ